jgi:hypothetical protein
MGDSRLGLSLLHLGLGNVAGGAPSASTVTSATSPESRHA